MLKLSDGAGKQPKRLPLVAAERLTQLCLADHVAEVFRDHDARVIAPGAIH